MAAKYEHTKVDDIKHHPSIASCSSRPYGEITPLCATYIQYVYAIHGVGSPNPSVWLTEAAGGVESDNYRSDNYRSYGGDWDSEASSFFNTVNLCLAPITCG